MRGICRDVPVGRRGQIAANCRHTFRRDSVAAIGRGPELHRETHLFQPFSVEHASHPFVTEHRELIHKIGVTGGKVETRIAGAEKDATYLLADVEVVATYKLHNLNRVRLENIFHRLFGAAQLDLTIEDRFGHAVKPREWFLVPLHVIDEAVRCIRDGSIADAVYDPKTASLVGIARTE